MATSIQGTRKTKVTHMVVTDLDIRAIRKAMKLNQKTFWKKIGVTQPQGSRYENDRRIPDPIRMLIPIAYPIPDEYLIPI